MYNHRLYEIANQNLLLKSKHGPGDPKLNTCTYKYKYKYKLEGDLDVGLGLEGVSLSVIEEIIESMKNQSFQFNPNIDRNSGFHSQKHTKGKILNHLKNELPATPPLQQVMVNGAITYNTNNNNNNNTKKNKNKNTKKNNNNENNNNRAATSTLNRTGTFPIAPPRDQIVLEVLRMILELIFEPTFSPSSHGFRTGKSCHTALKQIYTTFGEAS